MLGLNLIHAGFLAAGLAVAVPIVIHLLFRQRTRTVPIGSLRFLNQVVKEHRRRRRVRQWLLLCLRMLAVLLLVLLFCRPYWDRSHRRGLEQEVVLLVDRSASMQARDARGESSWDRARGTMRDELSQLDENVIVHPAVFDASGVVELPIEQILKSAPNETANDFGLAFDWARDILAASNRATRKIVLVSDLQRSGLRNVRLEPLPEGVELEIRDVGDPLPRNISIESATAVRTEIRPSNPITVRVVLRNHSPIPTRNVMAKCEVESGLNSRFVVDRTVDIPGNGTQVTEFPLGIESDGLYHGQVTIDIDDAMALDNKRWIAFEARHPDRILLVDGQEGRSIFSNETYFLETALRLQTEAEGGPPCSFESDRIVWEAGKGFPRLDGYRAVVLANVRQLSDEDGKRMQAYLRNGGSLLIFAGDQVSAQSLMPLKRHGLLPGHMADSPVEGRMRVDRWDKQHPALACFQDPQQGDLRRVMFHKLLPLTSLEPESVELLGSGDFIVAAERSIGKGRCLYFASTADREWTELPRTPIYVPLMRQLLAYSTAQLSERSAVTNQTVTQPQQTAGITPKEGEPGHWLVRNIDPLESAMQRIAPDELLTLLGAAHGNVRHETSTAAGLTLPADSLRSDEIWTSVVWVLFAVLAAELLLAGRLHA